MSKLLPIKKGDQVKVRTTDKAKGYGMSVSKMYTVTNTINSWSKRGQYIELDGMGDT